jgi:hypothetical protein
VHVNFGDFERRVERAFDQVMNAIVQIAEYIAGVDESFGSLEDKLLLTGEHG